MTTVVGNTSLSPADPGDDPRRRGVAIVRIPPELRLQAAVRLVGEQAADPLAAANRFLESAHIVGIDFTLAWGAISGGPGSKAIVRQICLPVVGSGRTVMLFLSGASKRDRSWTSTGGAGRGRGGGAYGTPEEGLAERVALVNAACAEVASPGPHAPRGLGLAQALLEPREKDAIEALAAAGFHRLGDLAYLRRPFVEHKTAGAGPNEPVWPSGITVRTVAQLLSAGIPQTEIDRRLLAALEASYIDTLDCPELCGMRRPSEVLESHQAVGRFDPALWWLVDDNAGTQGCMLFSACPEHDSVELVYLGLSPTIRGQGLGAALLAFGLSRLESGGVGWSNPAGGTAFHGTGGITCAVDTRNEPAMRLYRRAGFSRFGVRIPMVKSLRAEESTPSR